MGTKSQTFFFLYSRIPELQLAVDPLGGSLKKSLYGKVVQNINTNFSLIQTFFSNCHPTDLRPVEVHEFLKAKTFLVGLFVRLG